MKKTLDQLITIYVFREPSIEEMDTLLEDLAMDLMVEYTNWPTPKDFDKKMIRAVLQYSVNEWWRRLDATDYTEGGYKALLGEERELASFFLWLLRQVCSI